MQFLFEMLVLREVDFRQRMGQLRTVTHAPSIVKGMTYDKLHDKFERPSDALGYMHRNPLRKMFNIFSGYLYDFVNFVSRIEFSVRIRPN